MGSRRAAGAAVAVAVLVAAGGGWWWTRPQRRSPAGPARVLTATAAVVRTDLASTVQLPATLGYAGSYQVAAGAGGTVTALPRPGQVIRGGQALYEVDGAPVYLFYGSRPSWRPLAAGVGPGPDVTQLEANLTRLGYGGMTVDERFTAATAQALRRWQRATGQPVTGRLALGRVGYEPGPVRVAAVGTALGTPPAPGTPLLTLTSTRPVVSVAVPPAQTVLVHPGDPVTVTLPTGRSTPGRVTAVSPVAVGPPGAGSAGIGAAGAGPAPGRGGDPAPVSVPATVSLADPAAAAGLDQAPVTVTITDRRVAGVLAVPVTALVALAGGGYAVWVDDAGGRRLVPVAPGLFATTLVQVTGRDLRAGDRVEVPTG
jgi:peptidoglycan hydrolase-like protein with peptidoglycan-binding domain